MPLGTTSAARTRIAPITTTHTIYARTQLTVPDPTAWQALNLWLDYKHGAAVYLNGREIARANLTPNAKHGEPASAEHDTPADKIDVTAALAWLKPGRNVLAIEVHNLESNTQAHIDVQLWAWRTSELPRLLTGPHLGVIGPDTVTIQAESNLTATALVEYQPLGKTAATVESPPATLHRITLRDLSPNTTYQYRLGFKTPAGTFWSVAGQWTTDGGAGQAFRFAVWGDNRPKSGSAVPLVFNQLIALIEQRKPLALAITLGDNVQNVNAPTDELALRNRYHSYLEAIGPVARQAPFYSVIGNHDTPNCKPCLEAYRRYLPLPEQNDQTYYSFNYGSVHFVVLNSEQRAGTVMQQMSDHQWQWLQTDLANNRQPITFVFMHQAIIRTSNIHGPYPANDREKLHQLFRKHNVLAVFQGHAHYYDFYELDNIAYIISGGAGSPLYDQPYNPLWEKHHALIVSVTATQVMVEALLPDGKLLDQRTLKVRAP